jgi:hypothetical protein
VTGANGRNCAREVLHDALASGERWCAGALACWLRRAGVSLDVNPGGQLPYERVVHSLRLLTEKVMPQFS